MLFMYDHELSEIERVLLSPRLLSTTTDHLAIICFIDGLSRSLRTTISDKSSE